MKASNSPRLAPRLVRRVARVAAATLFATAATNASAVLSITNGDFEAGGTSQNTNIPNWFNYAAGGGAWWLSSWSGPLVSATGSNIMGLSGEPGLSTWAYQSIGTNDRGLSTLRVQLDVGSFTDAGAQLRDMGITVHVFQATGSFVGADNRDILGSAGVTQIHSTSFTTGPLTAGQVVRQTLDLNIGSANPTGELFLRFSNSKPNPVGGDPWTQIDNIRLLLPPTSSASLVWAGATSGGTWDVGNVADWNGNTARFNEGDRPTFNNVGAVNSAGVSIVYLPQPIVSGDVTIDSTQDYRFEGPGGILATGAAMLTKRGAGTAVFANAGGNTFAAGISIVAGSIELTGARSGTAHGINGGAIANNGNLILNRTYLDPAAPNEHDPLVLSQEVSGSGALVVRNHALLGEAGSTARRNTYTGPTTLESGFTYLADVDALGSPATGTTVMSGATLGLVHEWHLGLDATISEPLTLGGRGVVTSLSSDAEAGALFVAEGVRTFSGAVHLQSDTLIRIDGTADARLTGGLTAAPNAALEKAGTGTLRLAGATIDALSITAGTLQQTGGTMQTTSLSVANGATFDLTDASLTIAYDGPSPYADLLAAIRDGRIITSNGGAFAVGILQEATSAVRLRGTARGDADLSGSVDFDDLLTLAAHYGSEAPGDQTWQQGDFDYNGHVNFDDLLSLASNYGQSSGAFANVSLPTAGDDFAADLALAQSLVPEPCTLVVVAATPSLFMVRRRRRR